MTDNLPIIAKNPDAERSALGVILIAPNRIGELAARVEPSDFFTSIYRKLYAAALRLEDEHRPIEALSLADVLGGDLELQDAGGVDFISSLADGVYARANLSEYGRLIKSAAQRRQLQAVLELARQDARDPSISLSETLQQTESALTAIREGDENAARTAVHISEIAREVAPMLERVGSGNGAMLGNQSGFPCLDRIISGIVPSQLLYLAGRPSSGKTSFLLELVRRQAMRGSAVAMFSLEMDRASVFIRLACRESGVGFHRVSSGCIKSEEFHELFAAIAKISRWPVWIDDRPALSSQDLRWRLRSLARRQPIKLCVVDYLQLLRAKAENRTQEVTRISLDLKAAARELGEISGGALLAAAQLNRAGATNDRPRLHHLRESGQLEQDADVVLLLSDEKQSDPGQPNPSVKLLDIAKQRNGPTTVLRFVYLPYVMGFEEAFEQAEMRSEDMLDSKSESAGMPR